MANAAEVLVRVVSDTRAAQEGLESTSKSVGRWQNAVNAAAKVVVAGFVAAGGAALKLAQGAAEDQQAQVRLATVLKNTTGATDSQVAAVEDWITAQGKVYGITDDELRPALGRLATATGSVTKAQDLASLSMDVAAGTGKSFEQVSTAMARAATGNVGALGRLGIATKNADGSTKSFVQIQEELAKAFGGSASAQADTLAGKMTILKTQLSEAGETVGYMLLPPLTKLATYITSNVLPKIEQLTNWMSENTGTVKILAAVIGIIGGIIVGLAAAIKVWTAVQWALNSALLANPVTWIVVGIVALIAVIVLIATKTQFFQKLWATVWGAARTVVVGAVNVVKSVISWIAKIKPPRAITGPFNAAKTAVGAVISFVKNVISWIGKVRPPKVITAPFNAAKTAIGNVISYAKNVISWIGKVRPPSAITGPFNAGKTAIGNVISYAKNVISWIGKVKPPAGFAGPFDTARDAASKVAGVVQNVITWVGKVKPPGGFAGPFETARSAVQRVIDGIQSLIGWLGKIKVPDIGGALAKLNPFDLALPPTSPSPAGWTAGGLSRAGLPARFATDTDATAAVPLTIVLELDGQVLAKVSDRQIQTALARQARRISLTRASA